VFSLIQVLLGKKKNPFWFVGRECREVCVCVTFLLGFLFSKNTRPARPTRLTRPRNPDPSYLNTRRVMLFYCSLRVGFAQTRGARVGWPNGPKPARTDPCPALTSGPMWNAYGSGFGYSKNHFWVVKLLGGSLIMRLF
jgi:hypothetical protein